jgi:hypothetical protein
VKEMDRVVLYQAIRGWGWCIVTNVDGTELRRTFHGD